MGLSQMQILEHSRQLFIYTMKKKTTEKGKILDLRQKRGSVKSSILRVIQFCRELV